MADIINVADYLAWAEEYFTDNGIYFGHGTDNAWDEAVMLLLHVMQLAPDVDQSIMDRILSSEEKQHLIELATQRVEQRIPVAYLTNTAWFAGERYYIDKNAIIPRSPFAELISQKFQPWLGAMQPQRILDLCTGSACIAIYCAKEFPNCVVDAVDISDAALHVAHKNIVLHNSKVNLIKSDVFAELGTNKYDIIISNLPYVSAKEMQDLPPEYLHEPSIALSSGADGLELTEQILAKAKHYLHPQGLLIVEVGSSWETLAAKLPLLPFIWLEFSQGGEGVFLLHAEDL